MPFSAVFRGPAHLARILIMEWQHARERAGQTGNKDVMEFDNVRRIAISAVGALLLSVVMVGSTVGPAHAVGTGQAVGVGAMIGAYGCGRGPCLI